VLNKPGFTFRPGGIQRESVTGDQSVHGYTETIMSAKLSGNLTHTEQQSLEAYGSISNATIVITTNSNQQYVMRNAWQTDAPELNAQSGEVSVSYESAPAEKM
jgi:hypothetical protein